MITTVTFNPSLDYIVSVENFRVGITNRTATEQILAGGKGLNVSTVLQALGIKSRALGFVAGFTGEEIIKRTSELGILADFIRVPEGFSRINVKMKNIDGTEINGQGPVIPQKELDELYQRLDALKGGDVLVLAGSVPASMPKDIYRDICERLHEKGVEFTVDAGGALLMKVLSYQPFLIKPNRQELAELFANEGLTYEALASKEAVLPYARRLKELGAKNVIVSLGPLGAVYVAGDGSAYQAEAPDGEVKNTVGAGDSMVAGFLAGCEQKKSPEECFAMAVAAGTASALSDEFATGSEVQAMLKRVKTERIR